MQHSSAVHSTDRPAASPVDRPVRAVTLRALVLGLLLVVVANLWCIHAETIARTSRPNMTQFPVALVAPFVLFLLILNPALNLLNHRWALTRPELFVAIAMGLVGAGIPTFGVTSILIGILTAPFYYASPENQWDHFFHGHIPSWLAPRDTGSALTYLFEGLPPGAAIPWDVWLVPLFWWGTLIAAVAAFSLGIAVILRRSWAEHQRLAYPLLTPAIPLTEEPQPGALWSRTALTRLFWAGFAVALLIDAWNYFSFISLLIPSLPRFLWPGQWFYLNRYSPPIWTRFNLYTFGFGYFVNLDVLLGIWIFLLLMALQLGLFRRVGYQIGGGFGVLGYLGTKGAWSDPETVWQSFGSFTFLVLWGLYISRRHLIDVVRKALRSDHPLDDTGEMLSCRAAVCCTLGGLSYTLFWFHAAGLELRVTLPFLFALLVIYIGISRFVAEAGILYAGSPMSAEEFAVRLSGTSSVSASSMTVLTFSFILRSNGPGVLLPALTQVARLSDLIRRQGRRLVAAILLTVLVAFITSILATLYAGYAHGAANFRDYLFVQFPPRLFDRSLSLIKNYTGTEWERFMFFGIGAGLMALLTYLRYRFPWWPLHPIGLPAAGTGARNSVVSIVMIWGIKSILLRVGGVSLYRRGIPFFIGIIVGHAIAVLLFHFVDQIWFPRNGHWLHVW